MGLGCFWAPSEELLGVEGVVDTRCGYAGAVFPDARPSYASVCGGDGNVEAVQVTYDDAVVSYEAVLDAAFAASKPVLGSRQYAPIVFASDGDDAVVEAPDIPVQERLRLFWRLATPYFKEADGAKLQFGLLLALVLAQSSISVIFSFVGRDFYSALSAKDQAVFAEKTLYYAVGLAVATPLTVLYKFQRQRLALNWREWMTTELARQYYSDQAYYKVELERDIDNPDQRLTEDVTAFTKVSLDFFITLMTAAIDLVSFSGILYSIYPNLFYAIFVYAGVGSFTTVQLGKTLVGQNAEQLLREAGPNSNLQLDFNVSVRDSFDATSSALLRELDESDRFVQKSAESTSI